MSFTQWHCNESDSFLRPLPPLQEYIWSFVVIILLNWGVVFSLAKKAIDRWSSERQEEESDLANVLTIDLLKRVIIMIGDNW